MAGCRQQRGYRATCVGPSRVFKDAGIFPCHLRGASHLFPLYLTPNVTEFREVRLQLKLSPLTECCRLPLLPHLPCPSF